VPPVIGRPGAALAILLVLALTAVPVRAETCARCVVAGAASVPLRLPEGVPLAGYGTFRRRLLFPDLLGWYPHTFWFKPAQGTLDTLAARALVLETPSTRLVWVTVDLVAVDGGLVEEIERRLTAAGLRTGTLFVSASHTHSGPGAFVDSALFAAVALDRFDAGVRDALADAIVTAVRAADARRIPALVGTARAVAPPLTRSRLARPLDSDVVVLKFTTAAGAPLALVWNYAIHGTMLSARNLRLSGDVMGVTSRELERTLGVPALFVNGAVADVSPARHGAAALDETGRALATVVRRAWDAARPAASDVLAVRRAVVELPAPALALRNCVGRAAPALGRWLPRGLVVSLDGMVTRHARLVAAAVGSTAWVTIPGELQTALGQLVRARAGTRWSTTLVAGLTNDYLGYFVTAEDFEQPAYVTCASVFGGEAGRCLAEGAGDLLREVASGSTELRRACTSAATGTG
jgi:neutral ceramidase